MSEMESLRRGLNPLVLNLQKMELELTCPICLKLLNLPTFLPCNHVSCSFCATSSINGYGCPLCKMPFKYQDLKPATQIEAVVNIYKNLSSTLSGILMQENQQQVETPDGKMASEKSGNSDLAKENTFEFGQEKIYNMIGSKLGFLQKCANETEKSKQDKEGSKKKAKENADVAILIEQKGPCGSPSSEEQRDLDCDSNDLDSTPVNKGLNKREIKVGSGQIVESKKQKLAENLNTENKIQDQKANALIPVECGFCHTSEITDATGPILHYIDSSPVNSDKAWLSNALHAHEKCIEWAPRAFFDGDRAMNLEPELVRAAKMKCTTCGLKGAALGCYSKICKRSFHFPCAIQTPDCRFDLANFLMVCPVHSTKKLPCDKLKSKSKKAKRVKSPSLESNDLSPCIRNDLWTSLHPLTKDWLICGSALTKEDKEILDQFEYITGVNVTNNWESNVTHVIASTNEQGGYSRTLKVLMAILGGKWVLSVDWLKACIKAGHPVDEEQFETNFDVHGTFNGPKTGRLKAKFNAPLLFSDYGFFFSGHFMPYYKSHLEELIFAAGGIIGTKTQYLDDQTIVIYSTEPPQGNPDDWSEVIDKRKLEAQELACMHGCLVVPHTWILDSVAACTLQKME